MEEAIFFVVLNLIIFFCSLLFGRHVYSWANSNVYSFERDLLFCWKILCPFGQGLEDISFIDDNVNDQNSDKIEVCGCIFDDESVVNGLDDLTK